MKVVFIGAGIASLVASEKMACGGIDTVVYEKDAFESLTYDWHDDINEAAFSRFNLPMPKEGTYFKKGNWAFLPPSEKVVLAVTEDPPSTDWSTERRLFAQQYVERAKQAGVEFCFGAPVEKLLVEGGKVKGIVVGGENIAADLVVDNSGAMSPFRGLVPSSYKIQAKADSEELFYAYRAFQKATDAPKPKHTYKAYLKHLGEKGISWCNMDPSGTVNVLIGRIGGLDKATFDNAYKKLKETNPILGDEVVRGGGIYIIPVRYPLTRMVADGYAAIGDAAFMTIPMLGSGIQNSMYAGCLLSDVVLGAKTADKETLWKYQYKYFQLVGATHVGVDVLKRWMLNAPAADIDFLFESGVLDENDMSSGATGDLVKIPLGAMLKKAALGIKRVDLLLTLSNVLNKCTKGAKIGKQIPEQYDEAAIGKWESRVKGLFE